MVDDPEKLEGKESPEVEASEELLKLGFQCLPENIQAVIDQQKTLQHPEGFETIVNTDSLEELREAMKEKNIKQVVHSEGESLWIHTKLAMTLIGLMDISDEKKSDLKLIMLYHDLGKTTPGMEERPEIKKIQEKEVSRGKLYKVAKGHAVEKSKDIEDGFRANGISGHKLEVFMTVVKNHMETSLPRMTPLELVKLFEGFGKNDDERKEVAELLALAMQADSNACSYVELRDDGRLGSFKEENRIGFDFDKIWARYEEGKKQKVNYKS